MTRNRATGPATAHQTPQKAPLPGGIVRPGRTGRLRPDDAAGRRPVGQHHT
ncbi:hypothetical protein [Streptomyces sp. NPDC006552]|uniref:hypothetical protein n=1 Tax=Streptomyces sp. NPDC006552 TaxID=3157179 RepID=UPI0033BCBB13